MLRGAFVIGAALAVLPSCGGECGEGTVRFGDTCVLVDPFDKTPPTVEVSPGRYTREVGTVRLQANEPATIYYTTDGTVPTLESPNEPDTVVIPNVPDTAQLRYFAIDRAGNRSSEELRVWIIDREGPPPPSEFNLTFANPSRTVQWVPPPDPRFGGVLLARVEGQLTSSPVPGRQYTVGDELGPGITVVDIKGPDVTTLSMFTESMSASPGLVRYVAWGYDDLYNYGAGAGDYEVIPHGAQSTVVNVNAGTQTVSVTSQPSHITISGTAVLTGNTLDVDLAIRNNTTRVLYAPKVVLKSSLPGGITLSNASGTLATSQPFRTYGAALQPATSESAQWLFTGASSSTTLSLSLEILDGPILYATHWDGTTGGPVVDQETGTELILLSAQTTGPGSNGMTNRGGITPDGRLIVGAKTAGAISTYDLASGTKILESELRAQKAQVPALTLDPSGTTAYVLVADGHPNGLQNNGAGESQTELVRVDATTLVPNGRIDIGKAKVRSIAMSPDGKTLVIASGQTSQGVIVVDLVSFTIKRRIVTDFRPAAVEFVPGSIEGSQIVIIGERIAFYSLDGTPGMSYQTPGTNGKVMRAVFASADKLWVGRYNELALLDLGTGSSTLFPSANGKLLEVFDGKLYHGAGNIARRALDGTLELSPLPALTNVDGHWLGRSPF